MSLLNKMGKRKVSTTTQKLRVGKTAKRAFAAFGASFILGASAFGFGACATNDQASINPEEQTSSQQAQFNELQEQMKQLQNEMKGLKEDISKLKENDAALLQLITSNMTIVQNLISDLQGQISSISSQTTANKQDIDSLKQNQASISSQLTTLKSNMQSFESELETLKGQTSDKADSKVIEDLQKSVASTQAVINMLISQNAINATFVLDYNDIYVGHVATGNNTSGHYYTAPDGEFAMDVSLEGLGELEEQKAVYDNGLLFLKDADGEEQVITGEVSYTSMHKQWYVATTSPSKVVADDNIYTFEHDGNRSITFYLTNEGRISRVTETFGDDDTYTYSFRQITKTDYSNEHSYIASQISNYAYYQQLSTSIDKSFDYKYGILSATMSDSYGQTGDGKILIGNGEVAEYATTTGEQGTTVSVGILSDGQDKYIGQSIDGEIVERVGDANYYQHIDMQYYANALKESVFWETFKIAYDSKTDTYTVSAADDDGTKQVFTAQLDENGKFTSFGVVITSEEGNSQTLNYEIQGATKAAFEKEFKKIIEQYGELLAKKNENQAGI